MFDRNAFYNQAIKEGRSPEEINAFLASKEEQPSEGRSILEDITRPFRQVGEGAASFARLAGHITGVKPITGEEKPLFLTPEEQERTYQKPLETGAKTVAGLASWAVPAGKTGYLAKALPFLATAGRASKLVGGATKVAELAGGGAAVTGLQEAAQPESTPQSVISSGKTGAIANPLLTGVLGMAKYPLRVGAEKVSPAIKGVFDKMQETESSLLERAQKYMVGQKWYEKAQSLGILDRTKGADLEHIQSAAEKTFVLLGEEGRKFSEALNKNGVAVQPSEFLPGLLTNLYKTPALIANKTRKEVIDNVMGYLQDNMLPMLREKGLNLSDEELSILIRSGFKTETLGKILTTSLAPGSKLTQKELTDFANKNLATPLSLINDLKQALRFPSGNKYNPAYNYLKNFIENKSGLPTEVRNINKQYHEISEIYDNLSDLLDKRVVPTGLGTEDIATAVQKAGEKIPSQLNVALTAIAVAAGVIPAQIANTMGAGPLAGGVGGLGASWLALRGMREMAKSPEAKKTLMDFLNGLYTKSAKINKPIGNLPQVSLEGMIKQLGVRGLSRSSQE